MRCSFEKYQNQNNEKKKLTLPRLALVKETIVGLNEQQQHLVAGGEGTQTCQCPTPPYTGDYLCIDSHNAKATCVNCIRTLVNEKTENLCY